MRNKEAYLFTDFKKKEEVGIFFFIFLFAKCSFSPAYSA